MSRILLDSSVWLSFFTDEDAKHSEAERIVLRAFRSSNNIFIPDLIFAEIINVSSRLKSDPGYVDRLIRNLSSLEPIATIVVGGEAFWREYVPYNISRFKLKTSDSIICCYATYLDVNELHTFDKKLAKAWSSISRQQYP